MLDRTQTIEKLKASRQYLDEHYGVQSMTLFGSLARNEQREDSDVDICVEMVPNLFNRAGVKIYLQELLGCDVDVVRMRENMNPLFKQQILKYGIRVYWETSDGLWDLEEYWDGHHPSAGTDGTEIESAIGLPAKVLLAAQTQYELESANPTSDNKEKETIAITIPISDRNLLRELVRRFGWAGV